jgi:hypothetical protein
MTEITPELIAAYRSSAQGIAFSDINKWPDSVVENALIEADTETDSSRWGTYQDNARNFKRRGMFYYASHWLAVTYLKQDASDPTAISPIARLNVASKSVGDESVTYRVGSIQTTENDFLSLTIYGVEFLRLRGRAAKGAMVV